MPTFLRKQKKNNDFAVSCSLAFLLFLDSKQERMRENRVWLH